MNTLDQTRRIVVGVDGTEANQGAVRYAVAEAATRCVRLDLVHVVPDYVPISPMMPLTPFDLTETGRGVLDTVLTGVATADPSVEARGRLRHGTRATQLLQAAEATDGEAAAEMVVVGRDGNSLLERLLRGDTAVGVAARAGVPVVQVPAGWSADAHGVVLVGVKAPEHAGGMLATAFELAHRRGARLVLLHAWKLPNVYDDIIEARVDVDEWQRQATAEMDALLRDWRVAYPDVDVETRVVHDHAWHALAEASLDADLLLIVRRGRGLPAATHLGSTARAVLRAAHCPVCVVPPASAAPLPPPAVEEHAVLTP